jgi:4-diphosphocytidyl-2-C-methyl-D-erythritol kinase
MQILSPAKINLHLRVGPLANDGFHPLLSWMCTTGLYDVIEMEDRAEPGIELRCDRPAVPTDETNLIVRAGRALDPRRGANVRLKKRIPMGGGLGGGSSNAAAALVGFNTLWNLNESGPRLTEIAATLGSDVPFFLSGRSSLCEGRGEKIAPIAPPLPKSVVLILPEISIATPAVYRKFDQMKLGSATSLRRPDDFDSWSSWPAERLLPALVNDLERPAFVLCPELVELRDELEKTLGRIIRMSGSGSTLFTLADEQPEAEKLAATIRGTYEVAAKAYSLAPPSEF